VRSVRFEARPTRGGATAPTSWKVVCINEVPACDMCHRPKDTVEEIVAYPYTNLTYESQKYWARRIARALSAAEEGT
jgi:hypothetical protein